jgi:hypothetical protein
MLSLWDLRACAQQFFGSGGPLSVADIQKREQVLQDIMSFQPGEASHAVNTQHLHSSPT